MPLNHIFYLGAPGYLAYGDIKWCMVQQLISLPLRFDFSLSDNIFNSLLVVASINSQRIVAPLINSILIPHFRTNFSASITTFDLPTPDTPPTYTNIGHHLLLFEILKSFPLLRQWAI